MYEWEKVEADTDSTLRLVHESFMRGHTVCIASPNGLTIRETTPMAFCGVISRETPKKANIPSFYKNVVFNKKLLPLGGFDVIFLRDNPPLKPLVLNFLDSVKDDALIMNDIDGIRKAASKIYTASLDSADVGFVPKTYVSKNKEYLKGIFENSAQEKMILKPIDGFGGQGVIVLEKSALQNFNSLLDFYIGNEEKNYVILQEYVSGAEKGDVRVLMLNGEIIGAMKRVPAQDDIRSNVHQGGRVEKHTLTKEEKMLCTSIGPQLVRDGLFFVGVDIINGKLIEVNVMSPGGITRINALNKVKLQKKVLDFVENVYSTKEFLSNRRSTFRKVIEDADNGLISDIEVD